MELKVNRLGGGPEDKEGLKVGRECVWGWWGDVNDRAEAALEALGQGQRFPCSPVEGFREWNCGGSGLRGVSV